MIKEGNKDGTENKRPQPSSSKRARDNTGRSKSKEKDKGKTSRSQTPTTRGPQGLRAPRPSVWTGKSARRGATTGQKRRVCEGADTTIPT